MSTFLFRRLLLAGCPSLRVIPNVSSADKVVTLDIALSPPGASVAIQLTAKRLDKDNDGILEDVSSGNLPVGPPTVVKDLDAIFPHAKDSDPRAGHIQFHMLPPPEPGEYFVNVTVLDADPDATARQLLVVYSRSLKAVEAEVLPLADLPSVTPQVLLSEVFLSLRSQASGSAESATLWIVDHNVRSTQLTKEGLARTPRWGPPGKYSSWIAYSFAESRQASADIWVLDSSNPTRRQQVTRFASGDVSPIWSPDGSRIAFIRDDMLITAAVNGSGNEERVLERSGLDQLILWDARSNSIVFAQTIPQSQALEIWSINMATRRTKALTYTPFWKLVRSVAGSHNHNRLLVEWRARTSDKVDIYAIDFPGQTSVNLTESLKGRKCSQPTLSVSGNEVAFIASDLP
jgi:dipeptidyl aminopeptidase/acylaminoacyl peptidase